MSNIEREGTVSRSRAKMVNFSQRLPMALIIYSPKRYFYDELPGASSCFVCKTS